MEGDAYFMQQTYTGHFDLQGIILPWIFNVNPDPQSKFFGQIRFESYNFLQQ